MAAVPRIAEFSFAPLDIPLRTPFGIAGGTQEIAENVLVRLRLDDGTVGLGEAAPFPAVNGETQAMVLAALPEAARALSNCSAERYRLVSAQAREVLSNVPSALAAVETALLDALCRRAGLSLWSFFGGAESELRTDITIPTGNSAAAHDAAISATRDGFTLLKVKIGGASLALDLERLAAIHTAAPAAQLVLDANASLTAEAAIELLDSSGPVRERIVLFEQPTAANDWDGLREVGIRGKVAVAADESARSTQDVARLASARAVNVVNIKITKAGLIEAWDMAATARAHGLGLMIGGMVESELCMTTSACLAGGLGGFRFVDLDTPLFMAERPLRGGFAQFGPRLSLSDIGTGHGVTVSPSR